MARKNPGRGSDQFPLRLPDGMRDAIKKEAEANGRSMNAEIVARLDASLARSITGGKPGIVVRLEALPPGSEPMEVSVASFLTSFDKALKETVAAVQVPLPEKVPFQRHPSGLKDPIDE